MDAWFDLGAPDGLKLESIKMETPDGCVLNDDCRLRFAWFVS